MGTAITHPVPDRVNLNHHLPFLTSVQACTLTLRAERQSAGMSKITNNGLTRSDAGCFIAVPVWQQWASKG